MLEKILDEQAVDEQAVDEQAGVWHAYYDEEYG